MANRNESIDLIREKQELDIFLSDIIAGLLPHKIVEKQAIGAVEAAGKIPVFVHSESLDLMQEKREIDNFLSNITSGRQPDRRIQEKPPVTVGMKEQILPSDKAPAYAEPDSEKLHIFQKGSVAEQMEEKQIVSALKGSEERKTSVDPTKDIKPAEDSPADGGSAMEEQFRTPVVNMTPDSVEVQQEAPRKSDLPEILLSDDILKTDQTVELKIEDQSEKAPAPPEESMDKEQEAHVDEPSESEEQCISKNKRKRLFAFFIVFIVFIIIAQGYLWIYPDAGHETVQWICSRFPVIEQLFGVEKGNLDIVTNQVEFIDVKQRFVSNESLGNIRIIEGVVINQADVPISKIKVMGELLGSGGELLAARISYCGNLISDETLGKLNAEEISSISSALQSENALNNRIMPKGQIPFMIVFTKEPAGVAKATVTAMRAEKISP
ncbi:MAG: DUF3426 domain-containing protein [Syntrophaceae bacterium]